MVLWKRTFGISGMFFSGRMPLYQLMNSIRSPEETNADGVIVCREFNNGDLDKFCGYVLCFCYEQHYADESET